MHFSLSYILHLSTQLRFQAYWTCPSLFSVFLHWTMSIQWEGTGSRVMSGLCLSWVRPFCICRALCYAVPGTDTLTNKHNELFLADYHSWSHYILYSGERQKHNQKQLNQEANVCHWNAWRNQNMKCMNTFFWLFTHTTNKHCCWTYICVFECIF